MIDVTDKTDRPPVNEFTKLAIKSAFNIVPNGKTQALIAIWDFDAELARLHYAWKANENWKVGAQVGWSVRQHLQGYAGIEAAW